MLPEPPNFFEVSAARASEPLTFRSRDGYPRADPFTKNVAFERTDATDDCEQSLSERARRVDVLLKADEINSETAELIECREKVLGRACETIKAPDEYNIEPALVSGVHHNVECGSVPLHAADALVDIFVVDDEPALFTITAEVEELEIDALRVSAHPRVDRASLTHRRRPGWMDHTGA